jgi:hypothetical protein|tara:strand:+ start:109 stop:267 length:159 start_codon:yes stop_codon:yes gene_type:complete
MLKLKNNVIPYGKQKIDSKDANVVKSSTLGKLLTIGPFVSKFENEEKKIQDF